MIRRVLALVLAVLLTTPVPVMAQGSVLVAGNVSGTTLTVDLGATDNAVLDAIAASVDGLEALLTTIDADTGAILLAVDGLEASVDGVEGLLTAIDSDTGAILLAVDGLEASVDGVETSLTAIANSVDGLEALLGGTLTVGTHAVTQSGTWTVQPGNTANTTAWLVTGTGGSFPVTDSGGSLTVDGTVTVGSIAAGDNDIGNVDLEIAGTAIAVNAGAASAQTLRVILASDDPGVGHLNTMEGLLQNISDTLAIDAEVDQALVNFGPQLMAACDDTATDVPGENQTGRLRLNCTTLALHVEETGGVLTSLQILDDWDESDRAKVNLIVGQAGIAAGAGAVGVTVPRVTLASDDPAVGHLNTMEGLLQNISDTLNVDAEIDQAASNFGPQLMGVCDDTSTDVPGEGQAGRLRISCTTLALYVQESGAALTALQLIDNAAQDHDAVDVAGTWGVGLRAIAHGTNPTVVAAGDRTVWYANRGGIPFVIGGHPNVITAEAQVQDADGAQTDAALVTVSAGTKIVVTQVMGTCDNATTNGTNIAVGFGATTLPSRAHTGVAGILGAMDNVPPGGGFSRGDGAGILGIGADGEDLRLTMEDPAGGNCSVTYSYYTVAS